MCIRDRPTGEIINRHPDAVVVVTTNVTYEGCRGLNQSVIDRMSLVHDVELPSPEIMAGRAMSVTGFDDDYQVAKMVQVVNDLSEYMRKNGIPDGSCGCLLYTSYCGASVVADTVSF